MRQTGRMKKSSLWGLILCLLAVPVWAGEYQLEITPKIVSLAGKPVSKIAVNGTIPGPVLRWKEGEEVTIAVTNRLNEDSSVHWHGLLLPGAMDGVPGLNGFPGIRPGETFLYRFKVRQSGTYWYHAHSMGQEQDGHYGAIVVTPAAPDPVITKRDYVVLLSDFSNESAEQIRGNLKMHSAYYNKAQRTVGDWVRDVRTQGLSAIWKDARDWSSMRMSPTDLADVSGYRFLINGRTPEQNWTGLFTPGERVRLRFINASAMSFFDVRIPGLSMQVVAADGQNLEPVTVDEFRMGGAETYDVVVQPTQDRAYTIVAEPIDRSGFALGTLAPREGMRGELPSQRPRSLLTLFDMNMDQMMQQMPDMDMSSESARVSGWANASTPPGHKALRYQDLRMLGVQPKSATPMRERVVRLGGNMERYIWTIDGQKYDPSRPIHLNHGERLRLTFVNETMMAHPMHLHGMFVQLENGQPADKMPNKHTVVVPPGQTVSVQLTADETGDWMLHCHLLYHMMSGMMTHVSVGKPGMDVPVEPSASPSPKGQHHHVH